MFLLEEATACRYPPGPQFPQGLPDRRGDIGLRQSHQKLPVAAVIFFSQCCLLLEGKLSLAAPQKDLEAFHPAHSAQLAVDLLVEGKPQPVRQFFPGAVVETVGGAEHAVQIEQDRTYFHRSASA